MWIKFSQGLIILITNTTDVIIIIIQLLLIHDLLLHYLFYILSKQPQSFDLSYFTKAYEKVEMVEGNRDTLCTDGLISYQIFFWHCSI